MKILAVVHQFLPRHRAGTEIHTDQLARALKARGHDITVLACEHTGDRPQYSLARRDYAGIPVIEVAWAHGIDDFERTYANPEMNRVAARVVREVNPDLVHFQHTMFFGFDIVRAVADVGKPMVATLHEYYLACHRGTFLLENLQICEKGPRPDLCAECAHKVPLVPQRYGRDDRALALPLAMERRAATIIDRARHVDLFLSPSRFLRERMIRAGIVEPHRIAVVEHGLPMVPPFPHRARAEGEPLRIAYVGTVADYKGLEVLIRAANRLTDLPNEIQIHGALDWFPQFVERMKQICTNPRVRWMGGFPAERGPEVLAGLELLVVPSLWFENAPVTILEAFRAGVPVLATDLGGMRESLSRGGGVVFGRDDDEALARAIRTYATDEDAYHELCLSVPKVRTDAEMAVETETYFERVLEAHERRQQVDRVRAHAARLGAAVAALPRSGKKVLFVNPFTLPESVGGVQMHMALVSRELRKRGHEPVVFRSDSSDPTAPEFAIRTAEFEGTRLYGVNYRWSDFDDGFERILTNPSIDRSFCEILEKERPDVVHAHGLTCLSSTVLEEAKRRGVRVGITLHDFWMGCPRGQRITRDLELCTTIDRRRCVPCLGALWPQHFPDEARGLAALEDYDRRIRRSLELADFLVTPSEYHRRMYIREWGIPEKKIHAVAPGLDPAPYEGLKRTPSSKFRVGFIGSVIPSKGVHTLIDAVNRLPAEACVLRIHGEAFPWHDIRNYEEQLKSRVKRSHPVEFCGRYKNEDLPKILGALDVLVVPSLWYESYCMTIREGFLAGVPVICSRLGPMADAVEDGVTGLLYEPGNVDDLTRCLRRLLDDARLRNDLSRAPKAVPSASEVTDQLLAIY
ncbi:MAG: glycosyltransferase family 4 protein [Planctomycetes bacterium]|nr:glycosyltransferase family 4 protein [Planctomycetota bacterium]